MTVIAFIIGVALLVVGLAVSIALHELGHLFPAKRFGVRVGQYMIGFGPTLWSRRIGETEYGFKALPLGGYISMAGMYPPSRRAGAGDGADGSGTEGKAGGGFFATMVQDARAANDETLAGRDGDKVQSRVIRERLMREAETNVAIRVNDTPGGDAFEVSGRGELQMGVLIENMRREGFELSISRPQVLFEERDGERFEPLEEVTIDVDEE